MSFAKKGWVLGATAITIAVALALFLGFWQPGKPVPDRSRTTGVEGDSTSAPASAPGFGRTKPFKFIDRDAPVAAPGQDETAESNQASLALPPRASEPTAQRDFRSAASTAKSLIATGDPTLFDNAPISSSFNVTMVDGRFVVEAVDDRPYVISIHWIGRGVGSTGEGYGFDPAELASGDVDAIRPLVVFDDGETTRVDYGEAIQISQ